MKTKITFSLALMLLIMNVANATIHTVQVANFSFTPSTLNIISGDTVSWVWISGTHEVVSLTIPSGASTWDSPINSSSTQFQMKFTIAGTYNYECSIHPTLMQGTITVATGTGIQETKNNAFNVSTYPNPFSSFLFLSFSLPEKSQTNISIYDIAGNLVKVLADMDYDAGYHILYWDGSNQSGTTVDHGLYFYIIQGNKIAKSSGKIIFGF